MGDGECEQNMLITLLGALQHGGHWIFQLPPKSQPKQCLVCSKWGQSILSMDEAPTRSAEIPPTEPPAPRLCLGSGAENPDPCHIGMELGEFDLATYKNYWWSLDALLRWERGVPDLRMEAGYTTICPDTRTASVLLAVVVTVPRGSSKKARLAAAHRALGWLSGVQKKSKPYKLAFFRRSTFAPLSEWSCVCSGCSYSHTLATLAVIRMIDSCYT